MMIKEVQALVSKVNNIPTLIDTVVIANPSERCVSELRGGLSKL